MIYLKLAISREDNAGNTLSRDGTAEFMFRNLDSQSATRLAVALLKARGWRCVNVVDAADEEFADAFERSPGRQRLFKEALLDDVAYAVTLSPASAEMDSPASVDLDIPTIQDNDRP